jgi:hypothetical protein
MSNRLKSAGIIALCALPLTACATTSFVSSWKAPDVQSMQGEGSKVVAVVMHKNEAARRAAEDALAREITRRGGQGVALYSLAPGAQPDETAVKAALEAAEIDAIVVLRPVGSQQEVYSTPTMYSGPSYRGFYGGYYGYGWGGAWGPSEIRTNTIVHVETLVYSVKQNKLVWAGQTKTTNPQQVDAFVRELAGATAKELRKQGIIG